MINVITHRGLDAEGNHPYTESSREAFTHSLHEGFGIEFDIRITKDSIPVISHDESLTRITKIAEDKISNITQVDFSNTKLPNGHTILMSELIKLLRIINKNATYLHALHLKHHNQTEAQFETLLPYLSQLTDLPIIVFDVNPSNAQKLKKHIPTLKLAASVAHSFDVQRYNSAVGGTLLTVDDMVHYTELYDWIWLDEWDRTDEHHNQKTLYEADTFDHLRTLGYKISVVSPELHATSPNILGGRSHQDADNEATLRNRWYELIDLVPDAICTDYPHIINQLIHESSNQENKKQFS